MVINQSTCHHATMMEIKEFTFNLKNTPAEPDSGRKKKEGQEDKLWAKEDNI